MNTSQMKKLIVVSGIGAEDNLITANRLEKDVIEKELLKVLEKNSFNSIGGISDPIITVFANPAFTDKNKQTHFVIYFDKQSGLDLIFEIKYYIADPAKT